MCVCKIVVGRVGGLWKIKTLTGEIDSLKSEIAELNPNMKRGGEDREKENNQFQLVVEQRSTQKLLTAALDILKGFCEKQEALVQEGYAPLQASRSTRRTIILVMMGMMQTIKSLQGFCEGLKCLHRGEDQVADQQG